LHLVGRCEPGVLATEPLCEFPQRQLDGVNHRQPGRLTGFPGFAGNGGDPDDRQACRRLLKVREDLPLIRSLHEVEPADAAIEQQRDVEVGRDFPGLRDELPRLTHPVR